MACGFRIATQDMNYRNPENIRIIWIKSPPQELPIPLLMDHDISHHETPELPLVPVRYLCVGSLCRELLPGHKLTMPSERPLDLRGLSAPEELSLPLAKDHNLRDTVSSELPRATLAPPFRVHHDPSDGASSELPRVPVIHFCVEYEGQSVGSLCRELLPGHKLTMPSERPLDLRGLSAPEELSLPLAKDHNLRDTVSSELPRATLAPPFRVHHDPSDGASSELPRVAVIHFCVEYEGQSVGSLCRELLPGHKLTMPSERPLDLRGLSAPEELSLPLAKDHNLRDTVSSELPRATLAPPFRVHHDPSDGASSELPRVAVIHFCVESRTRMGSIKRPRRANFTAVDGSPPSRRRLFRITTFSGVGSLCRELLPGHKLTMPSERPLDLRGLSAPEELSLPLAKDHNLRDTVSSELPRATV
ncbi:hypothetical protein Cantr_09519 [Candida viswanathii]|uniref:Uncharacterized protein n=1 Tax=Candida viswanathii TaxID=5486 RepID=A0A367YAM6_9ASCO|nr:hypothetical protein Cantr_09519 [Candida viswanathii]